MCLRYCCYQKFFPWLFILRNTDGTVIQGANSGGNRALLLLAYGSMRGRTELVSLRIEGIEWSSDEGASIMLRRSKIDQHGSGRWIHLCTETTSAVEDWLHAADLTDGLIFRRVLPEGSISNSLCDSRVPNIYKSLSRRAELDERIVAVISGHSMPVGDAQDLQVQGASVLQIMVKGGWAKTDTVMRYIERVHQYMHAIASP